VVRLFIERDVVMKFRCVAFSVLLFTVQPTALAQVLFPDHAPLRVAHTYDVLHYKLQLAFDESARRVDGTTSIRFAPSSGPIDSIGLDAEAMTIASVTMNGRQLSFSNRSPILTVHFGRPLRTADTVTIAIEYSCTPAAGLYFIQPDSTDPHRRRQIWTQGEDTDNHFWFPCYDAPDDKATSEVIATVPEAYTLLSNGKLLGTTADAAKKTRTYHWYESRLHSSYLIMIAAGNYDVIRDVRRGIPLEYYVYPDRRSDGVRSLAVTPSVMEFFEDTIGVPYPWEKYAQIWISNFMWGGMENVSAVTLNDDTYLLDPRARIDFTSDDVVAHELAHQWWGDLVTSRDWSNLWLHEGFANYFEALYKRHSKGEEYFQYDLHQQAISVIGVEQNTGRSPLVGKESYTVNVYSKGCWLVHMLRAQLGEKEFWKTLRALMHTYAYRNFDTDDFVNLVRKTTGRDMRWFFDQWAYKAGTPRVRISSHWDDDAKTLQLVFTQTQQMDSLTGVFRFPLTISCTTEEGEKVVDVMIDSIEKRIAIPLSRRPLMVIADKGKSVLATFEWPKSKEEYLYQLANAADVVDRVSAARALLRDNSDPEVFEGLRVAALRDRFWAVRNRAMLSLATSDDPRTEKVVTACLADSHSTVRASAVDALSRFHSRSNADLLWRIALTDSSYLVLSSCLGAMMEIDSLRGFELAAISVDMESYRNIIRRSALRAMLNAGTPRAVPYALKYVVPGNPQDIRQECTRILGSVAERSLEARRMLLHLLVDALPGVRRAAVEGMALLKDPEALEMLRDRMRVETDPDVLATISRYLDTAPGEPLRKE
jgi:aminopeptidase N